MSRESRSKRLTEGELSKSTTELSERGRVLWNS